MMRWFADLFRRNAVEEPTESDNMVFYKAQILPQLKKVMEECKERRIGMVIVSELGDDDHAVHTSMASNASMLMRMVAGLVECGGDIDRFVAGTHAMFLAHGVDVSKIYAFRGAPGGPVTVNPDRVTAN